MVLEELMVVMALEELVVVVALEELGVVQIGGKQALCALSYGIAKLWLCVHAIYRYSIVCTDIVCLVAVRHRTRDKLTADCANSPETGQDWRHCPAKPC